MKLPANTPAIIGASTAAVVVAGALVATVVISIRSRRIASIGQPGLPPRTEMIRLPSQPFPDAGPGVLVHAPPHFSPLSPWKAVVYFRGFGTCVQAVASSTSFRCGSRLRSGNGLAEEFDKSAVGNALLIMPELRVNALTGDPGQFSSPGGFDRFIDDLSSALEIPHPSSIEIYAHSGGYLAASKTVRAERNNPDKVALLDAFYGEAGAFKRWIEEYSNEDGFRFTTIYSTHDPSAVSLSLKRYLEDAGMHTTDDLNGKLVFKGVGDGHGEVPKAWFRRILSV